MIDRLLKQGSHYVSGSLLISIAGLISFPILTRLLPISEYGLLSLLTTILSLLVAICKLGLQQSVLRYYSSDSQKIESSVLVIFIVNVLFISVLIYISFNLIEIFNPRLQLLDYFFPLFVAAVLQSYRSIILNYFASDQKTKTVNAINVFYRYFSLLLMVLSIILFEKKAIFIIYSLLISEFLVVMIISGIRLNRFNFKNIDKEILRKVLYYGFPLMLVEVMQIGHAFIDRFLINYFLGAESVALYSAPYSIAEIISTILMGSIASALIPIYMKLWNDNKKNEVEEFLTTVSDYFLLFFPVLIVGGYIISAPLMSILASEKYSESAFILPIALCGIAIFSSTFIYSAGLRVRASQSKLMIYVFESLIINIVLNSLFISEYGIYASAYSTVISYLWMSLRYYFSAKKILVIRFNINFLIRGIFAACLLYLVAKALGKDGTSIIDLVYNIGLCFIAGIIFILLLDKTLRNQLKRINIL